MQNEIWNSLNKSFTVFDIMTDRDYWDTITINDIKTEKEFTDSILIYDATPILANGLIDSFILKNNPEKVCEITKEWLITSDTTIPDLIEIFVNTNKPALFVFQKQELVGLITPADLNKIEARLFIYILIGQLELTLVEFIKNAGKLSTEEIFACLSGKRQREVNRMHTKMTKNDVYLDSQLFELLNFSDLINILCKSPNLSNRINLFTQDNERLNLDCITDLRNEIMHLVKPLIENKYKSLKKLCDSISQIELLFDRITEAT